MQRMQEGEVDSDSGVAGKARGLSQCLNEKTDLDDFLGDVQSSWAVPLGFWIFISAEY